jgi:hypothetical protein
MPELAALARRQFLGGEVKRPMSPLHAQNKTTKQRAYCEFMLLENTERSERSSYENYSR